MSQDKLALFERLLPVLIDLYHETAGLSQGDGELQLWYNRGYADGMVSTMRRLDFAARLDGLELPAPLAIDDAEAFLPWGKAYRHGFEMGEGETREALAD
ncbi:MAG: hypothetical protein P8103_15650 [Candidatus Thiodiazotropha sp.]